MQRYEHGGDIYTDEGISLDFSVNTNPLGMPEAVKKAVINHIPEYARYPDPACRALRAALAEWYGLEASKMLCGNGASELIFALCACCKPRRILIPAPTFSEYERSAALFGGAMREHRLLERDDFTLTESILAEITPETEMLFLCNPNNPTGRLADPALLRRIAEACRHNGTLLLLDECFIDFTQGESMLSRLEEYPHLLVLQAFTKIYAMAGLRLGMLYCADTRLLRRIAAFSPEWSVSGVAQAAGIAALQENGWIEKTRRLVEQEREFMTAALRDLGLIVYSSEANYLLLRGQSPLYEPLRARGFLVRSCANFTGLDQRYIRIGLKTHDENRALLRAIREVLYG
ncbi:MAG: threonine-phosphate decarboxylase CobD [Clostridia bacterium]|jgi:threonine-phosphate decarboxylase|nr:threonine-phosphate decarboxylase CobD [Clostridia bacterium]